MPFDFVFREPDGLGPLYIRTACASCHEGACGPGAVQKDGRRRDRRRHPAADQSALPGPHRPPYRRRRRHPIAAPRATLDQALHRLGPSVFGRGYMEAVDGAETSASSRTSAA
jgi:hypothetical protein